MQADNGLSMVAFITTIPDVTVVEYEANFNTQTLKGLESDSNRYTKIQSISSVKTLIQKGKN
jgi:flagellar assembly factor FliW